ncbi:MAG TPA: DUF2071 domain-containing protein [Virgibacillus sp.]|nr:DUF2071 domain-containing protein [Virgibacillus sp.]
MNLPWIGVQHWQTPAFFHWPVPYDTLSALVPTPFELDTFNNENVGKCRSFSGNEDLSACWATVISTRTIMAIKRADVYSF